MKKQRYLLPISLLMGLLFSCNTTENKHLETNPVLETTFESVIKPIKGLETKAQIYTVNANESSVIELPNSGKISFPENAFVNQKGEIVNGDVTVSWNEFHSITDLILSGIPMKYDSLGKQYDFVSGGMFSISASQGNEKLELAPSKKAKIDLVSIDDTPCHNFYKIDEKTGAWDYLATKNGEPIPGKATEKGLVKKKKENNDYLLDTKPTNLKDFPELNPTEIIAWKCNEKISKQEINILKKSARKSKLIAGETPNTYRLEISLGNTTKTVKAEPYTLNQALKENKKTTEKLEKDFKDVIDFQNNVAAGRVMRSIQISGFGTFNWDVIYKVKDAVFVNANFNLPDNTNIKLVRFFMFCPENNIQIACTGYENTSLGIDPTKKHCIIGIMPDNRLVYVDNASIINAVMTKSNKAFEFEFKDSGIVLKSGHDLAGKLNLFVGS